MKRILLTALLLVVSASAQTGKQPIHKLTRAEQEARLKADIEAIRLYHRGLVSVIAFAKSKPELFTPTRGKQPGILRRDQKEAVWNAWQRFLDYTVALRSIERYYSGWQRPPKEFEEDVFMIGHAAFLAQYRAALEWIALAENNPELDTVLNDRVPEIGLPAGSYAQLKLRFLNIEVATEFGARELLRKTFKGERQPELQALIDADAATILRMGKGKGELLTLKNAWNVVQRAAGAAWLPVQAGVSEWMGDTKVHRTDASLISPQQVRTLQPKLEPGDVLLERREWYLSNIGLPGFWSHAALYVGTAAERRSYFADETVRAWARKQGASDGEVETLLQQRYPGKYITSMTADAEKHSFRLIEAMSEGVVFTSIEHSASCDSLVVLRPRLPKREKAQAIVRAFHYAARPYDFNFDFATDAELVCTELIYRAYEPGANSRGLRLPLVEVLGRLVTPANEIAKQFAAQFNTGEQQLDLIHFLDGQERQRRAVEAPLSVFLSSWQRPKWHILVQNTPPAGKQRN